LGDNNMIATLLEEEYKVGHFAKPKERRIVWRLEVLPIQGPPETAWEKTGRWRYREVLITFLDEEDKVKIEM
jgi:hypothetical protein